MPILSWLLLAAVLVVAPAAAQAPPSRSLTQADIDTIVSMHNTLRTGIAPIATNMMRVAWDPDLAASAQAYADTCPTAHSGKPGVGENLSWGWPTMSASDAVQEWIKEGPHYSFVSNACASGKVCAHYTQMIWSNSAKIGCAVKTCANILGQPVTDAWVCHYTLAGNVIGSLPYAPGPTPCTACPNSTVCVENLCTIPGTPITPSAAQAQAASPVAGPAQGPVQPAIAGPADMGSPAMPAAGAPAAPATTLPVPVLTPVSAVPTSAPSVSLPAVADVATSKAVPTVSPISPFITVQSKNRTADGFAGRNSTDNSTISTMGNRNSNNNNTNSTSNTIVGFAHRTFFG